MSRQLDKRKEDKELKRRDRLVMALEFGIVDALEANDEELLGFAFKYDAYNCLMTIKAYVGGKRCVCFIGSDSIINCILKTLSEARRGDLHWKADKFYQ